VRSTRVAVTLLIVLVPLSSLRAQRPEEPQPDPKGAIVHVGQTDETRFPDITVEVDLKAANGEAILDATREEFRVREYGAPVAISKFTSPISREFRPTTVVLVLDRSGSMQQENRIGGLKRAVSGFLKNQPKGSRVAVIAFASEVELICPFTDDPEQVQAAVGDLFADGKTHFYDAVEMAVKLLSGETGRRAILAMTDGEDNLSRHADLNSAIRAAQKAGLPVHTLGLGSEGELPSEKLRELSEATRGQSFTARQADGLKAIFEEIARNLGQTYSITYRTEHPIQDGTLRPIEVDYAKAAASGKAAVYIKGMVAPAAGWSWLFLGLIGLLGGLWILPGLMRRS
jgi:VWFA-related protein